MGNCALIIVDLQNDFLPGGTLAIQHADKIIPIVNQLLDLPFDIKVASKDWHPDDHLSFAVNHPGREPGDVVLIDDIEQILWPVHCVQNTHGADFGPGLNTQKIQKVFHKGTDVRIDSYSTFFDNEHRKSTGLADFLKSNDISDIYLAGLATDYCVKYSTKDSIKLGFNTFVVTDACKGVNLMPQDSMKALSEIKDLGAHLVTYSEVLKKLVF